MSGAASSANLRLGQAFPPGGSPRPHSDMDLSSPEVHNSRLRAAEVPSTPADGSWRTSLAIRVGRLRMPLGHCDAGGDRMKRFWAALLLLLGFATSTSS